MVCCVVWPCIVPVCSAWLLDRECCVADLYVRESLEEGNRNSVRRPKLKFGTLNDFNFQRKRTLLSILRFSGHHRDGVVVVFLLHIRNVRCAAIIFLTKLTKLCFSETRRRTLDLKITDLLQTLERLLRHDIANLKEEHPFLSIFN